MRFDPEQEAQCQGGNAGQRAGFDDAGGDGSCRVYRFSGVVWNDSSMGVALYGEQGNVDLRFLAG